MDIKFRHEPLSDQRIHQRARLSEPVRFEFKDPAKYGGCLSCDISEGGVRVRFNEFLALGTELKMVIHLHPDSPVECLGKVVWVKKIPFGDQYEVGFEFETIDSILESRSRINRFVQDQ